jgi:hypothetical protein
MQSPEFYSPTLLKPKGKKEKTIQNGEKNEWSQHHFIHLIVEGLKRAKVKPLNYSLVTVIQQGLEENPLPFCSILRTLSESIPHWTQSYRWERLSSKTNF